MKFKSEDFIMGPKFAIIPPELQRQAESIAAIANAKLQEWLDAAPTIYSEKAGEGEACYEKWCNIAYQGNKYKAKLVCIEEIK